MIEADDGVELWANERAPPGVPLVLCHGGPGMWDNLGPLAALLDHDRQVVRWDQRDCGRSGGADGPFSLAQSLADLEAVRQHLGISRWIVGGLCPGLPSGDAERSLRRVESDDINPAAREQAGQSPRSAPDVEHRRRVQLVDNPDVDVEVAPVVVHDVVQRSQSGLGEDRIRHGSIMDRPLQPLSPTSGAAPHRSPAP